MSCEKIKIVKKKKKFEVKIINNCLFEDSNARKVVKVLEYDKLHLTSKGCYKLTFNHMNMINYIWLLKVATN